MTTPTIEDDEATSAEVDVPGARTPNLNAEVRHRLRVPGPGGNAPRPPLIGSVASSSSRFASGLARSVPSRHQLRGPENVAVPSTRDNASAPPRWWSPDLVPPSEPAGASAPLTPRGLPRAVQSVPSEGNRTPGGILGSLVSTAVPVRRMDAVTAAGPMLTSHDRQKLSAVAVNRSMAQAASAAAASSPAPSTTPSTTPATPRPPAMPATAQTPATPPSAAPPSAAAPAAADSPPSAGPAPDSPSASPSASAAVPTDPAAPAAPAGRASFLPERRSRLAAVRGAPWGGFAGSLGGGPGGMSGGAAGGAATTLAGASFPRSVGALALAGADPLSSAVDTPAHVRPLPRMVGGGHTVSASTNAGRAPVAASDPVMFGAGRATGEQQQTTGPRRAAGRATALAAVPGSTPSPATPAPSASAPSTPAPSASAPTTPAPSASAPTTLAETSAPAPSITSLPPRSDSSAADAAAGPDAAPAASGTSAAGVAPGGGRGRRRANSEAVGIGLATTRSLNPGNRSASDVRPSLNTGMLSAMGGGAALGSAIGAAAGAAQGWLPGAAQRVAGARTSLPGALSLPGRAAAGMGMSDLLPSARGLAGAGESVTGGSLATAFGSADVITPAGSAASASPAPPTGAAAAPADAADAAESDTASPLQAAQRRARSRVSGAATGAAAAAATAAEAAGAATGATTSPAGVLAPLKRLVDTSSGTSLMSHMPAPPPVSIRSAAGDPVPPMAAAAGLAGGADGGLKRSLIDVTAGMFDSLPASTNSPAAGSGAPPIPASAQFDIGGSTMAEVERRLQVVRDGDAPTYAPSPLDDPAAMENLVDEVVQRIEARVIDELERRGRRHNPGVF